jgi:IS605 OrfB family transposase
MPTIVPFWNDTSKDISNLLWVPSGKDEWNVQLPNDELAKKHIIEKPLNSNILSSSSTETSTITLCKTVKIKLTTKQKKKFANLFHTYRFVYNKTLEYLKNNKKPIHKFQLTKKTRKKWLNFDWLNEFPERIIRSAIHNAINTFSTSFAMLKKRIITHFNPHFKTKRVAQQTMCHINLPITKTGTILPKYFKTVGSPKFACTINPLKVNGQIVKTGDYTLTWNQCTNVFHIIIPYEFQTVTNIEKRPVISIDPGIRTFITAYDPFGRIVEIGKGVNNSIFKKLDNEMDIIKSKISKTKSKRKQQIFRKVWHRKSIKKKNKQKYIHHSAAKWLCEQYHNIVIGEFNSSSLMPLKKCPKITKRGIVSMSHFEFRELLKNKAKKHGSNVAVIDESFTSKTCGVCGIINANLKGKKEFNCENCGAMFDRDVNGARNILIKFLMRPSSSV